LPGQNLVPPTRRWLRSSRDGASGVNGAEDGGSKHSKPYDEWLMQRAAKNPDAPGAQDVTTHFQVLAQIREDEGSGAAPTTENEVSFRCQW